MITYASESLGIRSLVKSYIETLKLKKPDAKICDVGGGINSWLGEAITDIIDMNDFGNFNSNATLRYHQGDICNRDFWSRFPDNHFDFVSCTHTLEDIRDPGYVLKEISRVAKAGFIAVPNRHQELSCVENRDWNGFCHHRWVFHVIQGRLMAICKFGPTTIARRPVLAYIRSVIDALRRFPVARFVFKTDFAPRVDTSWLELDLAARLPSEIELGVLWEDDIPFEYWNNDFAGVNIEDLVLQTNTFLSQNFAWQDGKVEIKHEPSSIRASGGTS